MTTFGKRIGDLPEETTALDTDELEVSKVGSGGSFRIKVVNLLNRPVTSVPDSALSANIPRLTAGKLADGVLSTNIPLINAAINNFTGAMTVVGLTSAGALALTLRAGVGGPTAKLQMLNGTGGVAHTNWQISKSDTVAHALQWTPSTAVDGATFTTPVMTLTPAGALTLVAGLTTGGGITVGGGVTTTGDVTINETGAATLTVNSTFSATANTRIMFCSQGTQQWMFGNNVATGGNVFEFYSIVGGVSAFRMTPAGAITIPGTVNTGPITTTGNITATGPIVSASIVQGNGGMFQASGAVLCSVFDLGAAVDEKWWTMINSGGQFSFRAYNDSGGLSTAAITFTRTGYSTIRIGFFNATPVAKPTVTGSKASNAALASLLTQLAALGLITDSST
jgi:hypothetical protein